MDPAQIITTGETITALGSDRVPASPPSEATWLEEKFTDLIKKGGKLVDVKHGNERLDVCRGSGGATCEYFGVVNPVPGLTCMGCTACGCALRAKAYMDTLLGVKIKCPYPGENKWAPVDHKFLILNKIDNK